MALVGVEPETGNFAIASRFSILNRNDAAWWGNQIKGVQTERETAFF